MKIRMKVTNHLGTYTSEQLEVTEEQYNEFVDKSKEFWLTEPSFYICSDDGAVIIPPEIARQSLLIIQIVE